MAEGIALHSHGSSKPSSDAANINTNTIITANTSSSSSANTDTNTNTNTNTNGLKSSIQISVETQPTTNCYT